MVIRRRVFLLLAAFGGVVAATFVTTAGKGPTTAPGEGAEAPAARIIYGRGRELVRLANKKINESSGLACGRKNKGVFWTHNDSGGRARIFAFDARGRDLAAITLTGARAIDWEDMASFEAGRGDRNILLLADTGDNGRRRKTYALYAIPEPSLNMGREKARRSVSVAQTIHFRYEDGSHDCEAVAVDPTTRTIYLVSKVLGISCRVYAVRWPARSSSRARPLVAGAVASLTIPPVTAMDISPDGLRAVVLTYGSAFEYVKGRGETWAQGFSRRPRIIPMPRRVQGESICYGPDGKTLYLTSEIGPGSSSSAAPLLEVPVAPAPKDNPTPATQPATGPAGELK